MSDKITFNYKNWNGDTRRRIVIPDRIFYGSTAHHEIEQWILEAFDVEKGESRCFALCDITGIDKINERY